LTRNQNPEQLARDQIDLLLTASGWLIQSFKQKNIAAGVGVASREYPTDTGPADYILFVDKKPVEVIEAKCDEEGVSTAKVEQQQIVQEIESCLSVCDKTEETITNSLKQ
jgi:type I restriction enzyme R subunit